MMKKHTRKIDRVGLAVLPRNRYILDVNLFAKYLQDTKDSQLKEMPMCLKQSQEGTQSTYLDISCEDNSSCDDKVKYCKKELHSDGEKITTYIELYSLDHTSEMEFEDGSSKHEASTSAWKKEVSSTSSNVEDSQMASCSSVSLLRDELESKLSLNGIEWGNNLYCDGNNWATHSCILLDRDNEKLHEQVLKNEF